MCRLAHCSRVSLINHRQKNVSVKHSRVRNQVGQKHAQAKLEDKLEVEGHRKDRQGTDGRQESRAENQNLETEKQ